jgi:hypothetical protein
MSLEMNFPSIFEVQFKEEAMYVEVVFDGPDTQSNGHDEEIKVLQLCGKMFPDKDVIVRSLKYERFLEENSLS